MKKSKKIACGVLAGAMVVSGSLSALAATENWNDASDAAVGNGGAAWSQWKTDWETVRKDFTKLSLTPGADETQLNFAWYSTGKMTPKVKIATSKDMAGATEATGTQSEQFEATGYDVTGQFYSNKVTVSGLADNTTYYYSYTTEDGSWSEPVEYSTEDSSNFKAMYVGDPQIGACKGQTSTEGDTMKDSLADRNDAFNWNKTLTMATATNPDLSFILSAGDQVNYADREAEYAGYLHPEALKSLPVSTTIGNHDASAENYSRHFYNPNTQEALNPSHNAAGTDYYYTYGDALFVIIDTNNYNCAEHENVIKKAIEENQDAKWRIVMFHQDIYGSGYDHSDSDGIVLRTQLTPIFDKYDIDVALQGHDHTYSRTFQLTGDGEQHQSYSGTPENVEAGATVAVDGIQGEYNANNEAPSPDSLSKYTEEQKAAAKEYADQNNCYNIVSDQVSGTVSNPAGTVYFEANSSTGSKFYNLITNQQDYIAERGQNWKPSYSVLSVNSAANSLSVTTYDATTGKVLEDSSTYTIVKDATEETLAKAIAAAEAHKAEEYTKDSYAGLTAAIQAAKTLQNTGATADQIAAAQGELQKAIDALVKVEKPSESEPSESTPSEDNSNGDSSASASSTSSKPGKSNTVKTGDTGMMLGFGALAVLSGAGAAGLVISDRRKKRK